MSENSLSTFFGSAWWTVRSLPLCLILVQLGQEREPVLYYSDRTIEDWFSLLPKLDQLTHKTITLHLVDDRTLVDKIKHRGNDLIAHQAEPKKVEAMNKIAGKNLSISGTAAKVASARPASAAASTTTPAPSSGSWAVSLPLQSAAAAGSVTSKSGGKARKGAKTGGAPGSAWDYNKALQAKQEAITFDPNGHFCQDCAKAGRSPHHYFKDCAYSECYRCKRGGHRAPKCTFPPYP
eukprot:g11563.t1